MTSLLDPNGNTFGRSSATGISFGQYSMQTRTIQFEAFNPATEIKPGDSVTATIAFASSEGRSASPGVCTLQLGFFLGDDFVSGSAKHSSSPNLVTKFEAK
jgi:hypothetical protein